MHNNIDTTEIQSAHSEDKFFHNATAWLNCTAAVETWQTLGVAGATFQGGLPRKFADVTPVTRATSANLGAGEATRRGG